MPHIGRNYPFHPTYWATECWFWPSFVPWKVALGITGVQSPDWYFVNEPQTLITDVGLLEVGATIIRWPFLLDTIYGPMRSEVMSQLQYVAGTKRAHVEINVYDGPDLFRRSWADWLINTRNWRNGFGSVFGHNYTTDEDCPALFCITRAATFEEGGSPFP